MREGFPGSLEGTPLVLPLEEMPLRRNLENWFELVGVRPRVIAAFEDSALMKSYATEAGAWFPAPLAVVDENGELLDPATGFRFNVEEQDKEPDVEKFFDERGATRLGQETLAIQLDCDGHRVDRFAILVELNDGDEDRAMARVKEVICREEPEGLAHRRLIAQARAQHRALGIERMRRGAVGRQQRTALGSDLWAWLHTGPSAADCSRQTPQL